MDHNKKYAISLSIEGSDLDKEIDSLISARLLSAARDLAAEKVNAVFSGEIERLVAARMKDFLAPSRLEMAVRQAVSASMSFGDGKKLLDTAIKEELANPKSLVYSAISNTAREAIVRHLINIAQVDVINAVIGVFTKELAKE